MIAIDSNVVVRYLVNDDRDQARRARMLIDHEDAWISKTVLLESARVLDAVYDFSNKEILDALEAFLGLAMVRVEDEAAVLKAVTDARAGMDFADALHVAGAPPGADAFLTFDRALCRTRSKGMRVKLVPN